MADPKVDYDVWDAVFNQTPVVIRWILGALTLGVFTLAGALYRWNRQDVQSIADKQTIENDRVHNRIDRLEIKLDKSTAEMNGHLIEIAKNTRNLPRRRGDYEDDE